MMKALESLTLSAICAGAGAIEHALFFLAVGAQFFALDHAHKKFGRLAVKLFARVVTNNRAGRAAYLTVALVLGDGNDLLAAFQVFRQGGASLRRLGARSLKPSKLLRISVGPAARKIRVAGPTGILTP
jgi:hypothetical protein